MVLKWSQRSVSSTLFHFSGDNNHYEAVTVLTGAAASPVLVLNVVKKIRLTVTSTRGLENVPLQTNLFDKCHSSSSPVDRQPADLWWSEGQVNSLADV